MPSATIVRGACVVALLASTTTLTQGQGAVPDYQRAERFLGDEIKKLVYDGQVSPQWIEDTNRFWYLKEGPEGKRFILVDPVKGTRQDLGDNENALSGVG